MADDLQLSRVAVGADAENVYAARAFYQPGEYSNDFHLNLSTKLYTVVSESTNATVFGLEFVPDSLAVQSLWWLRGENGANSSIIKFSTNSGPTNIPVKDWVVERVRTQLGEIKTGKYPAFVDLLQ